MSNIVIYYFSGTGNTKKVSEMVKEQLESLNTKVKLITIEEQIKSEKSVDISDCDIIGLAYPIYGFGTPSIVYNFINNLPAGNGIKLFIFKTGADYIALNHNASTRLIEKLEERNYSVFYDRIIVMPSNWLLKYKDAFVKQLTSCAESKVRHMCGEILTLKKRRYKTGFILKYLSLGIAELERKYGSKDFGKSLYADNSCNLCNICVSGCPVGNITEYNGKLIFLDKCNLCMRCIYSCPKKALKSRRYGFTILKDGYNLEKILEDKSIGSNYITVNTKGYFRHFYKYIIDESL